MTLTREPLRVLLLSPIEDEIGLVGRVLRNGGFETELERAGSEEEFRRKLAPFGPDVVVASHAPPEFDGRSAVALVAAERPGTPVVVLSAVPGEALAVDAMRRGAAGFVVRDRVEALAPAIRDALEDAAAGGPSRGGERYRELFERVPVALYRTSPEGELIAANGALARLLGSPSVEPLLGTDVTRFYVDPGDRERFRALIDRDREVEEFEARLRRVDGRVIWVRDQAGVIRDAEGRARFFEGGLEDITERKEGERELRLLHALADAVGKAEDFEGALGVAVRTICEETGWALGEAWVYNADSGRIEAAPVWHATVGGMEAFRRGSEGVSFRPGEGLPGRVWESRQPIWIGDVGRDVNFPRSRAARQAGIRGAVGIPILVGDEVVAVMNFFVLEARTPAERFQHLASTVASQLGELFGWKRAEAALRESEARFRRMAENAEDIIYRYRIKPEPGFEYVSPAATAITGYTPEDHYADPDLGVKLVHPADQQLLMAAREGEQLSSDLLTLRWVRKDGSVIWTEQRNVPVFDDAGEVVAVEGIARDITQRVETERRLRESEEHHRAIIAGSPMAIVSLDLDGNVLTWNNSAERLFGWTAGEVIGKPNPIVPAERREEFRTLLGRVSRGEVLPGIEVVRQRGGGVPLDLAVWAAPVRDDRNRVVAVMAFLEDITERKRAERQLRLLDTAMASAADAIMITDREGQIEWVNPAFTSLTGYTFEESSGKSPRELIRSGQQDEAFYRHMWETILAGDVWRGELVNRRKDGERYPEEMSITPVRDEHGEISRFVAIKEDITARKAAEAERDSLRAQLAQSQRLEAVGQLAGGVAHDYNNMLSVIIGYAQMILDRLGPRQTDLAEMIDEILLAAERSVDITRQLLAFARKQPIAPQVIELNETVEDALKMLRRLVRESIELSWTPGAGLWPVKVDPVQVDHMLANLCINAQDAVDGVGRIVIETANVTFDDAYAAVHLDAVPGDFVMLSVSDNGRGMDRETLGRIFEPFYTTKGQGEGTGLGLATVYGMVRQNDGFIRAYSEPGAGTSMRIYFPSHAGEVVTPAAASAEELPRGQGETVLLVEDEPAILQLSALMLEQLGYTVLRAGAPAEALEMAAGHEGSIDLLLTDVIMPGMDGRDLATRVQTLHPRVRVVFMSGYTGNVIIRQGVLDEGVHFVQKPFAIQDLAAQLRAALDEQP